MNCDVQFQIILGKNYCRLWVSVSFFFLFTFFFWWVVVVLKWQYKMVSASSNQSLSRFDEDALFGFLMVGVEWQF